MHNCGYSCITACCAKQAVWTVQDAAAEVASGATRAQGLEIQLDGLETCWLNVQSLLMALKDGQLWQVNLVLVNNIVDELKVQSDQRSLCGAYGRD